MRLLMRHQVATHDNLFQFVGRERVRGGNRVALDGLWVAAADDGEGNPVWPKVFNRALDNGCAVFIHGAGFMLCEPSWSAQNVLVRSKL